MPFRDLMSPSATEAALSVGPSAPPRLSSRRRSLLVTLGFVSLVVLLWAPFGLNVGPDTDPGTSTPIRTAIPG